MWRRVFNMYESTLVCYGRLDLNAAQQMIRTDWYAAYLQYVLGRR